MKGLQLYLLLFVFAVPGVTHAQGGIWTWMRGSSTQNYTGSYGLKGVAAATNEPPARYQACYWTDKSGNFWLFGGVITQAGVGLGNDLWKYDVSANMWTWVNGPNVLASPVPGGVNGVKGVPSSNNFPAARGYGANCWTDNNGDLWLYGGYTSAGNRDDLWKYNIASNQWTWVGGNLVGSTANFGIMGVAAATNNPGAMQEVKSAWVDAANNLWMFGGGNGSNQGSSALWKYTISTGLWTWMKGSYLTNGAGNFGTLGVETATNEPPARASYTRWKDGADNFYLFAGGNFSTQKVYNDVWKYNYLTNNWTWISGSNVANDSVANYPPEKCRFYSNYYPAARLENQTAFSINGCAKAFWTFGGFNLPGTRSRNDLWLFEIDSLKWSWVSGSSTVNDVGSYGSIGVPSSTNMPPSRGGQCMWIDINNNLWMFGGLSPQNGSKYGDLWRFRPDSTCINVTKLFGGHLTPPDTALCVGDTSLLRIGTHIAVSYTPGAGAHPNADTSEIYFNPTTTTAYTVIVDGGTCKKNDTLHFTIHPNPKAILTLSAPTPNPKCVDDTAIMAVNPLWDITVSPATDVSFQPTGGSSIKFYAPAAASYVVTAAAACAISDTLDVKIDIKTSTLSELTPMLDTLLCNDDSVWYRAPFPLTNVVIKPNLYYSANADSTLFSFFPPRSMHFTLSAMNADDRCSKSRDTIGFNIVYSTVVADFELVPTITTIADPVFRLRNLSRFAHWYDWYVDGQYYSHDENPIIGFRDTGTHCFLLVAKNDDGCIDTATQCGKIIDHAIVYLPNAFTPNGDGRNDVLYPHLYGAKLLNFNIYNRYGERVFVGITEQDGWNGTYNGKPCDLGTYFFYLKYAVGEKEFDMKGDINLLR